MGKVASCQEKHFAATYGRNHCYCNPSTAAFYQCLELQAVSDCSHNCFSTSVILVRSLMRDPSLGPLHVIPQSHFINPVFLSFFISLQYGCLFLGLHLKIGNPKPEIVVSRSFSIPVYPYITPIYYLLLILPPHFSQTIVPQTILGDPHI